MAVAALLIRLRLPLQGVCSPMGSPTPQVPAGVEDTLHWAVTLDQHDMAAPFAVVATPGILLSPVP